MHAEDNMWLVGVGGYEKEWPPMKDDELQEFAETKLWNSEISDLIKGSKRLAPAGEWGPEAFCGFLSRAETLQKECLSRRDVEISLL